MTNDNETPPPSSIPDSSPAAPITSNNLATTNNILATVMQSVSKSNNENKELNEKLEFLSRRFDKIESLLSDKVAPNIGQLNDFMVKHKDSIESIPFIEQEINKAVIELDKIISDNEKMASELLITTDEMKSIKCSNNAAPCRELELKLSEELEKAKLLNAKSTFESNCAKLILYGMPFGRSAGEDIRTIFGEEIKMMCVNTAEVTRLRARGQAGSDKVPPMLLEFHTSRSMRECRNLMREALRDSRDRRFVKTIRLEEFIPADLLPRKNFLHRIANAYKSKYKDIKLFRVTISRKCFDLRVFIRLNHDVERDNKAAGRTLTWAEIDEKTLEDLTPFNMDIFREKTFAEVARATVPQPMGMPRTEASPRSANTPNDDSGAIDNRMEYRNSPNGPPRSPHHDSHMPASETPDLTDDHPPLPPSPSILSGQGFPPLDQPKDPASNIFRSPLNNSVPGIPPLADVEEVTVKKNPKKSTKGRMSTRSEDRGVHDIEDDDSSTFTRMTNRQRKKSPKKATRELKAQNARGRLAAAAVPPSIHPLSSEEEI